MADNHSNNIRIGWKKDGSLNWQIMGDCQRTTMGFDSLIRFARNNPGIFGAKEILELAVVVKVVPAITEDSRDYMRPRDDRDEKDDPFIVWC